MRYEESDQAEDGPSDLALRADPPTVPSDLEVMELEEDPAAEPDPPGRLDNALPRLPPP